MSDRTLSRIKNYRYVEDRLSSSGQPSEEQLHEIAKAGFNVVINLAMHDDPNYSLPDEAGLVQSLGMKYVHIPVMFSSPNENDLLKFFSAMERHKTEKLWIHCAANKRVPVFLGLYRVNKLGWKHENAFALMNDLWVPNDIWTAFITTMLNKA